MTSEKARREEAERLMRWGFEQWERRDLAPAGAHVGRIDVRQGRAPVVEVQTALPIRITIPKGHSGSYRAIMSADAPLSAPLAKGTPIAELIVTPDGLPPQKSALLAADTVNEGGWWDRTRTGFHRLTGW